MSLGPIFTHLFSRPVPYLPALAVQNRIHEIQLARRRVDPEGSPDLMLLLEHRPVYTAGRRQKAQDLALEQTRLESIGADWVQTDRGGQTTYHGPGQITVYPLVDLGRTKAGEYICQLELALRDQLLAHGVPHYPSDHTGLFLAPDVKVASIGVHVRHRLTTHGIAMNITHEPAAWFDQVVACGLDGVRAGSIQGATGKAVSVAQEAHRYAQTLAKRLGRDITPLNQSQPEIWEIVQALEHQAVAAGPWPTRPTHLK
ncbi:Lipoyl(octanoyl) transferase [Ceratobasidium theobromae]|uniref:Octanoyltransferase n=1 Tax=Ceratobasidium theobromae TaxID=1582974 RepID=A0A5N5QJ07_9AGAM|nr:Lipoyl(octanoyl) transferase [Ceratobasidium theobromae]